MPLSSYDQTGWCPDLATQHERPPELDSGLRPCLRTAVRVQHHAQDAVDAEPGDARGGSLRVRGSYRSLSSQGGLATGRGGVPLGRNSQTWPSQGPKSTLALALTSACCRRSAA